VNSAVALEGYGRIAVRREEPRTETGILGAMDDANKVDSHADQVAEWRSYWHSITLTSIQPYLKEADAIMLRLSKFQQEEALAVIDLTRARLACCIAQAKLVKRSLSA
jgi:hypothetical protein